MKRRFFSWVLVASFVFMLMSTVAFAGTAITDNVDDGVDLSSDSTGTWSYDSDNGKITCKLSFFSFSSKTYTSTLTIENKNDEAKSISFKYSNDSSGTTEISLDGNAVSASADTKLVLTLKAGGVLTIKSSDTGRMITNTLTISDFAIGSTEAKLSVLAADGGYYLVSVAGENATEITADTAISVNATDNVVLTAVANAGYQFRQWNVGGTIYTDATIELLNQPDGTTIQAEFIPDTYNLVYKVGSSVYYSWNDAMTAAGSSGTVILLGDHELPSDPENNKGETTGSFVENVDGKLVYKVPAGVTFLIPYDSTLSTNRLLDHGDFSQSGYTANKGAYCTLTVSDQAIINVYGNLVVNAKRTVYSTSKQGVTTGTYGKMILAGTMNIKSGGLLVARGYIVDDDHTTHTYSYGNGGKLIAEDGSTVRVLLQVTNHRGGDATSAVSDDVMPITSYSFANIMMYTEYLSGSNLEAEYYVVAAKTDALGVAELLSSQLSDDCLFVLGADSKLCMDYNYAADQIYVCVPNGDITLSGITVAPKAEGILGGITSAFMNVTVSTADSQLPIADNIQVYIGGYPNGEASTGATANAIINNSVKLLPGASINVLGNGTATLPEGVALYVYDKNYDKSWSYNLLRTGLAIEDINATYRGKTVFPNADAKINIYSGGVANLNGIFAQYEIEGSTSEPAIVVKGENALLNIAENATIKKASIPQINETVNVTGELTPVSAWEGVEGLLAGISESSTDYELFETEAGTGEYKSVEIDGTYYWYKYAVTYNVTIGEEKKTVTQYICTDNTIFNATEALNGETITQNYVITYASSGTAGANDPNAAEDVSKGWENLVLTGITGDTGVDITVQPYQYRVQVTENGSAYATEYVALNADGKCVYEKTWDTAPMLIEPTFAEWDDTTRAVTKDQWKQTESTNSTTFAYELPADTKITLTTASDVWKVSWEITDLDGNVTTDSEYVEKGSDWTYTPDQPDDCWWIIEDSNVSVAGTHTGVANSGTAYTIKGVGSEVNVKIKLVAYEHQITVALIPDDASDSTSIKVNPYYFNGDSTSIEYTEIISTIGNKYTFAENSAITCEGANVYATKEKLTAAAVTAKSISFTAYVERYDAIVTIKQNNEEVSKDFYVSGEVAIYSFEDGIQIASCKIGSSNYDGYTNPAIGEDGEVTNAEVSYTVGTEDVTLDVKTSKFDYILTIRDGVNPEQTKYLSGSTYTYECDPYYYITNATTTAGTVKSGIGAETLEVIGINDNATIEITLQKFARKVYWYNSDTDEELKTTYLTNIPEDGASDSYTCNSKQVAWANVSSGGVTFESNMGETIVATGIQAKTAQDDQNGTSEAVKIGLKLYDYDYKVVFADGTTEKVHYVKNDKSVFDNADLVYQPKDNKYVSAYTVLDGNGNTLADDSMPGIVLAGDSATDNAADEANGWRYIKLTGVKSDVTVNLSLQDYLYKITWNVTVNVAGESNTAVKRHYVNSDSDTCTIGEEYTITSVTTNTGTVSYTGNSATVTGIEKDATVNVVAQDYKYKIKWIVDGAEPVEQTTDEDTVIWTMPETSDGKTYVVISADASLGSGTVEFTNKTVTVKPTSDMTVVIKTEEALTNYTALWGNMSFRYYKNAAYYGWDGEAYQWRLIEQYAWTHKSGSMIHTYADLEKVGEITTYTVPNGSVMIVNPTNQKITATVTIRMDESSTYWKDIPVVTLTAEDGTKGETTITVYLEAHETLLISATLTGTPQDGLTDQATGTCSVKIDPID